MTDDPAEGGCLCGSVRYRVAGDPVAATLCHCRSCRRASGGTNVAWAVFDRISLKRRSDAGGPPIPVGGATNDLIAVAVGVIAYLALAFAFHPAVVGVPVIGA